MTSGLLIGGALIVAGIAFDYSLLTLLGFAGILLTLIIRWQNTQKELKKTAAPQGKTKYTLIDAPQDSWDTDDASAFMAHMMAGAPGMQAGSATPYGRMMPDPLAPAMQHFDNPIVAGAVRNILPFPAYGNSTFTENFFIGFPISLGGFLKDDTKK